MIIAPSPSTVRHVSDDLENFLPTQRESLLRALAGQLRTSTRAADQNLGHLEEQFLRGGHELFRQMLEKAAQEKAAAVPPPVSALPEPTPSPDPGAWHHRADPLG